MNTPVIITVILVNLEANMVIKCGKCSTILEQGSYVIKAHVGTHEHIIGRKLPMECCGEKIDMPFVFQKRNIAEAAKNEVLETFERDGNTFSYSLHDLTALPTFH